MKEFKRLSEHYDFTIRQEQRIEDLVKDIAIGFIEWQMNMKSDYYWCAETGRWTKYSSYSECATTSGLFNEYLNTLK